MPQPRIGGVLTESALWFFRGLGEKFFQVSSIRLTCGSTPQNPDSGKVGRFPERTKKLPRRTPETPSAGSEGFFSAKVKVVGFGSNLKLKLPIHAPASDRWSFDGISTLVFPWFRRKNFPSVVHKVNMWKHATESGLGKSGSVLGKMKIGEVVNIENFQSPEVEKCVFYKNGPIRLKLES